MVDLAEKIAVEQVYPINAAADKKGAKYKADKKEVTIPEEYFPGLKAYYEAGFMSVATDPEWGGMGMPEAIYYTRHRLFYRGQLRLHHVPDAVHRRLQHVHEISARIHGRRSLVEKMLSGEWGGTMCLTEPDAGSDVGALKTKAVKQGRRHLQDHRAEDIHLLRRQQLLQEHDPPGPGPDRGRPDGHQGHIDLPRSQVPRSRTTAPWASSTTWSAPASSTRWASRDPPPAP